MPAVIHVSRRVAHAATFGGVSGNMRQRPGGMCLAWWIGEEGLLPGAVGAGLERCTRRSSKVSVVFWHVAVCGIYGSAEGNGACVRL